MIGKIYPGNALWIKRILYTIAAGSLCLNLWLNSLQNRLWETSQDMVQTLDPLLPSASGAAEFLTQTIVPCMARIENSRFYWMGEQFNFPATNDIQNHADKIQDLEKISGAYGELLDIVKYITYWTSLIMWWPIILSWLWLYQDLKKGGRQFITALCFMLAITLNYLSYQFLSGLYQFTV